MILKRAWLVLLGGPRHAFAGDRAAPHPSTSHGRFPEHATLAAGPWQTQALPPVRSRPSG